MNTPTYDSEGNQVWKPQPGQEFEPGLTQRESYGGIVAALQDVQFSQGAPSTKAYPKNFAGIIAAIEDLGDLLGGDFDIDIGPYPDGWDSNTGVWVKDPKDGHLWFDTRQGRLFIAFDKQYWQCNGGDGIPIVQSAVELDDDGNIIYDPITNQPISVTPPPGPHPLGTLWVDPSEGNDSCIIYAWVERTNIFTGVREPSWVYAAPPFVGGPGAFTASTTDVTLAYKERMFGSDRSNEHILPPDFPTPDLWPDVIPDPPFGDLTTQANLNEWLIWTVYEEAVAITQNTVLLGDTAPVITDDLTAGKLWFDTSSLELSILYEDVDSKQWVPITATYAYDEALDKLSTDITTESATRNAQVASLHQLVSANKTELQSQLIEDLNSIKLELRQDALTLTEKIDARDQLAALLLDLRNRVESSTDFESLKSSILESLSDL